MSIARTSTFREPVASQSPDRLSPEAAFDQLVWQNDEVCNRCFQQIRDTDTFQIRDTDRLATEGDVLSTRQRAGVGILGHDYTIQDQYGELRDYRPRTYCNDCGSNNGRAESGTMSRRSALEAARALAGQFHRQGVRCHEYALREFVRRCKSDPEARIDGHETEMFRRGAEFAIRVARERQSGGEE